MKKEFATSTVISPKALSRTFITKQSKNFYRIHIYLDEETNKAYFSHVTYKDEVHSYMIVDNFGPELYVRCFYFDDLEGFQKIINEYFPIYQNDAVEVMFLHIKDRYLK